MHQRGKTYLKTIYKKSICCKKSLKINYHRCNHKLKSDNQMAKRKRTNNDVQNTMQKIKDRATRTPLKPGVNSGAPER